MLLILFNEQGLSPKIRVMETDMFSSIFRIHNNKFNISVQQSYLHLIKAIPQHLKISYILLSQCFIQIKFKQQNILGMSDHQQTSDNQSFLNMAECQELKKKIALSSSELIELTYSEQKFNSRLDEYNKQACFYIEDQKYPQAAAYLDEAEKILQYSAGCGKTIERSLITTILNNQACLLQRTSDFEQSANYLEAIIFNINDFVEGFPQNTLNPTIINCNTQEYADFAIYLERKLSLALYHLRFCALTSHSKNNELALKSAKKALHLLKQITSQESRFQMYAQRQESNSSKVSQKRKSYGQGIFNGLFKQISKLKQAQSDLVDQFDAYLNKTLYQIQQYKKTCQNSHNNSKLEELFQSYSIGNLMQASILQVNLKPNPSEFMEKQFSTNGKIYRAIHTAMAYFTVATQLRLISTSKYALDDLVRKSSPQYRESKVYHLISVMLVSKFLPIKSVFYDHAIYSFKNHYGMNLEELSQNYQYQYPSQRQDNVRMQTHSSSSKTRSQHSSAEQNETMEIHDTKENLHIGQENNIARASEHSHRNFRIAELQNTPYIDSKKIKQLKSRSKILKQIPSQSTKIIESDKDNLHQSKNKENKSKNKILSRGKETLKSRTRNLKNQEDEDMQRKAIYYGFTNKSRSKSKKQIGIQKKNSKKTLQSAKSGLVFQSKKIKNQTKINQEYGVKTLAFNYKPKKNKVLRNSQAEEQCQYPIKFNKVVNVERPSGVNVKKIKSPRNMKKQTSRRKTLSKDKLNF